MSKQLLSVFGFLFLSIYSFGQTSTNKILFIIDSIPLLKDPEEWNQLLEDDISDIRVINNKDSLKLLGHAKFDGVTYIFTKEYRHRSDSLKEIPSLKQMEMKNDVWNLDGLPYSGQYIDYFNNGKEQNEGRLLNGQINGELIVYYKTGIKKSITNYKDGIRHGSWKEYYQNGALMRTDEFANEKNNRTGKSYFINGQITQELKLKNVTRYDTSIIYYSTGKIMKIKLSKNGEFHRDKKEASLNYHTTMFYEHLRTGDIKEANKNLYQILMIDSTSIDTYFKEGVLLAKEFRFNEAINRFDKALAIEPLMREALLQRGFSRLKKYKFSNEKVSFQDRKDAPLALEDIMLIPEQEKAKVCTDLILADNLDPGVNYNNKAIPEAIIQYCRKKSSR